MNRFLILLLLCFSGKAGYSQTLALRTSSVMSCRFPGSEWEGGLFNPGLMFQHGNWAQQVSWDRANYHRLDEWAVDPAGNAVERAYSRSAKMALQIQMTRVFPICGSGLSLFAGGALQLGLDHRKRIPLQSDEFLYRFSQVSQAIRGVGGARYDLSKRIFVDADLSFPLVELSIDRSENRNPQLPIRQQTVSIFGLRGPLSNVRMAVGVGYWLAEE